MADVTELAKRLEKSLAKFPIEMQVAFDEITIEVPALQLIPIVQILRNHPDCAFEQLMDLCGVDYLDYGVDEWRTESATLTGFSRGVERTANEENIRWQKPRFAVVYHLLSLTHNHRLRVRTFPEGEPPHVPSVMPVWDVANWFEREAFDLYGIQFKGHPDLRRILTDYGFIGHPFRKDFPLIGEVEPRYDAEAGRVINEPVSIVPRTLTPKVIRDDNRYMLDEPIRHGLPPAEAP